MPYDKNYLCDKYIKPMGTWVPRGNDCFITTIPYTRKRLAHNRLFFVYHEIIFLCSNCRQKLSINYNPFGILRYSAFLLGLTIMIGIFILLAAIFTNKLIMQNALIFLFSATLFIGIISSAFCLIIYFSIKLFFSNFVPTNEYDDLIRLPKQITLSGIPASYRHESNIVSTYIGEEECNLYITSVCNSSVNDFICGEEKLQKIILKSINSILEEGNSLIIPFTFEGKCIGNAEVIETFGYGDSA